MKFVNAILAAVLTTTLLIPIPAVAVGEIQTYGDQACSVEPSGKVPCNGQSCVQLNNHKSFKAVDRENHCVVVFPQPDRKGVPTSTFPSALTNFCQVSEFEVLGLDFHGQSFICFDAVNDPGCPVLSVPNL